MQQRCSPDEFWCQQYMPFSRHHAYWQNKTPQCHECRQVRVHNNAHNRHRSLILARAFVAWQHCTASLGSAQPVGCLPSQTYEGGLGGEPGNEAHGGYTFCGLAALMLVDQAHRLDLRRLAHWAVHMQVWPHICAIACAAHIQPAFTDIVCYLIPSNFRAALCWAA